MASCGQCGGNKKNIRLTKMPPTVRTVLSSTGSGRPSALLQASLQKVDMLLL